MNFIVRHLNKLGLVLLLTFTALGPLAAESASDQATATAKEKTLYTCGMHPQVIRDQPGNCPICGMKLIPLRKSPPVTVGARKIISYKSTMMSGEVSATPAKDSMGMDMVPVYETETGAATDSGASTITIDPVTIQNMNFRSELVKRGSINRDIRTVGVIDFDEAKLVQVTTKFDGWVEKLYADTTGQEVHRGDPLFEMYSPDFYKAQVEFIAAINSAVNMPSSAGWLRAAARTNLIAMGVPYERVAGLEKNRNFMTNYVMVAPQDGFVVEKMVVQGQKVDAGMKLYQIADLGMVWVQAQVYEQDLPFIKLGQEAEVSLSYLPDRRFRGRVTYIYPTVDEKTRTVKVRMEFHNPGYLLKPGMFTTVELKAELAGEALLIPDSAVLRSGERNTVFIALPGGKFEPRVITLGPRGENDTYQVFSGVNEGERVVTSGQFMLDSESQLREAVQKMLNPDAATATATSAPPVVMDSSPITTAGTNAIYICPMPEHVSIRYDHPGKCPLCGMTLVPVSEATLSKIQPGGQILYYTCPMTEDCPIPGHGTVHVDKPGKCPICGMTLIPVMAAVSLNSPGTNDLALPEKLYTCPMAAHADVVTDKPGDCPKCGMTLVPTTEVPHGKLAEENWRKQHQH